MNYRLGRSAEAGAPGQRHVDCVVLPWMVCRWRRFNVKDYLDFVQHDGLVLLDAGPGQPTAR
jgi:hypothetical protein